MPEWSTACPDWQERILAGRSLVPVAPLFPDEAEHALSILKSLHVVDIPGRPPLGTVSRAWTLDFVAAIFGAYDPEQERQLIREFLLLISKKNGKSTIAAAIMITALILNPRYSAEFIIVAPTKKIASNSYEPAQYMAKRINEDREEQGQPPLFRVYAREKRIHHMETGAELVVVASDSETVGGTKATVVLVDELHLFGSQARAMEMFREATGGLMSRTEGFVVYLSTMSSTPPAGVFDTKVKYARRVRDGEIEDRQFMPVIYEFPPNMIEAKAYRDPANFYVTNPNLGASVDVETLLRARQVAEESGEAELIDFEAKHLNVQVEQGQGLDRWVGARFWPRGADPALTLDEVIRRSEVAVCGYDGGGLDDLAGFGVLGRCRETKHWLWWAHAWCHRSVLELRKAIAPRLLDFKAAGDLTIVDDDLSDIQDVVDMVDYVKSAGILACLAVDPAGLGELVDALAEIDVTADNETLIGASQGGRLMNAIKTTERKLANGTLKHSGSPMMAWCVGNVRIEPLATTIRATKATAGDAKIDPVMAMFNAAWFMETNPEAKGGPSFWETMDLAEI